MATDEHDRAMTYGWNKLCELEAEYVLRGNCPYAVPIRTFFFRELSHESYGPDILRTVGLVYVSKAQSLHCFQPDFFGARRMGAQSSGQVPCFQRNVSQLTSSRAVDSNMCHRVSTLRDANELKTVFRIPSLANSTRSFAKGNEDHRTKSGGEGIAGFVTSLYASSSTVLSFFVKCKARDRFYRPSDL